MKSALPNEVSLLKGCLLLSLIIKRLNLKQEQPRQDLVLVWTLLFLPCNLGTSIKVATYWGSKNS